MNTILHLMDRLDAGLVTRFHTSPTIHERNVAAHSFNMMLILDWVYEGEPPVALLRAAMLHDLHERYMGDIPYPIKHEPELEPLFYSVEKRINTRMGIKYRLSNHEQEVLNCVDMLEFILYLLQEKRLGNTNNVEAFNRAREAVKFPRGVSRLKLFGDYLVKQWTLNTKLSQ